MVTRSVKVRVMFEKVIVSAPVPEHKMPESEGDDKVLKKLKQRVIKSVPGLQDCENITIVDWK